ncbi:hypothetical protein DFH07DRAFT_946262 [Mycena maculata]|uniref:Uncharacterized protein n=1 Tax=Mycena maculata TaxID=230809 RepID=A0AAD7MP96_9AGAR|nr:hypothetical protein DFH07DRAFT_946262 [Mycena maculata]
MILLEETPSRDPYWVSIHAALDLLDRRDRPFSLRDYELEDFKWTLGYVPFQDLYPGECAFCHGGTGHISYVWHEYLVSKGHVLTSRELSRFEGMKEDLDPEDNRRSGRPCIILDRQGLNYTVCFFATFNSIDITGYDSGLTSMLIPWGEGQEGGLRSYPRYKSSWVVAVPVVRERWILRPILSFGPAWGEAMRVRLSCGELERMRSWVRDKESKFATNHEAIRRAVQANASDPLHPASHKVREKVSIMQVTLPPVRHPLKTNRFFSRPPGRPVWILPSPACNNTAWVVEHAEQEIANASRYLSSVVRPPLPFRLPRPFYAPSLRATAAFVRRRIYQQIFTWR